MNAGTQTGTGGRGDRPIHAAARTEGARMTTRSTTSRAIRRDPATPYTILRFSSGLPDDGC